MAKKAAGVNKSQAIRDYKKANPDADPKEIAAKLGEAGIKLTPQFVSTILSKERAKEGRPARKRGRKPGRKPGRPAGAAKSADAFASVREAKKFADTVGGVAKAQAALAALASILG